MAKQLQLRRGTKQANDLFTGTEGELTMDTSTKGLRIHDGTTTGGYLIDTVVDFQEPSATNGYTWYRKYSSGWVEMGGSKNLPSVADGTGTGGNADISLPVTMRDNTYWAMVSCAGGNSGWQYYNGIMVLNKTNNILSIKVIAGNSASIPVYWEVKGMAQGG